MLFTAKIAILGINPYVIPPSEVLKFIFDQAEKNTSPIPVKGELNGVWFTQSLVRYQGNWRLYINGQMAKKAKLPYKGSVVNVVGQTVEIDLLMNERPQPVMMIPELQASLARNQQALGAFQKLTVSRQQNILRYLSSLKGKEVLDRNVQRVIQHLLGQETDGLYALMRREKKEL